jgi:hypothetical protein
MSPLPPVRETLRALVRSRRIERALAAARALPRPLYMRTSLSFLTTTTTTAPIARTAAVPHTLTVLGLDRAHGAVYFREDIGDGVPLVHVMHLNGEHAGRMVVARRFYDDTGAPAASFEARLAALAATLVPLEDAEPDAWLLTTRVIQRRALRIPGGGPPIRKFTLALVVEPIALADDDRDPPPPGRVCVTAYLRARATLDRVWLVPGTELAIARVTYLGVPSDVGHAKQIAILTARAS